MTDKYGFGQALASPSDATADIVFVHGLGGDRKKTWTADKTKQIPRETFWPQDLLPKACPTARILSFGYNSSFISFFPLVGSKAPVAKETTVDDYSSNLLHELSTFRNREDNPTPDDRPIIFVAHSLGGLVVANAVARQHGIDSEAKKLSDNTVGIVFLGTPFEGSKKAEWGKLGDRFKRIIPGIKTEDIKNLEERSAKLESINIALNKYVKERDRDRTRRPLNIVCYFEEHPTYEAGLDIGKIVTKPSATTLPAIPARSIDADHQDMCKFAGEFLRGYQSVSGQLVQWVKDLKKKLPADTDAANVPANSYSIREVNNNEGVVAVNIEAPKDGGYLEIAGKKVEGTNFFGNAPIEDVVKLVEAMGRTKKERK